MQRFLTKRRLIAFCTTLMIILNLFSPYSILAATPESIPDGKPYFILKLHDNLLDPDDEAIYDAGNEDSYYYYLNYLYGNTTTPEEGTHLVTVDVILGGTNTKVTNTTLNLIPDTTKLKPGYAIDRGKNHYFEETSEYGDFASAWSDDSKYENGEIAISGGSAAGEYLVPGQVCTSFTFILSEGLSIKDLSSDVFKLGLNTSEGTGLRIVWEKNKATGDIDWVDGEDYLVFEGFASSTEKTVT